MDVVNLRYECGDNTRTGDPTVSSSTSAQRKASITGELLCYAGKPCAKERQKSVTGPMPVRSGRLVDMKDAYSGVSFGPVEDM